MGTDEHHSDDGYEGPPKWVKISVAIAVALILLFVVLKLAGVGGDHGPARHGITDNNSSLSLRAST